VKTLKRERVTNSYLRRAKRIKNTMKRVSEENGNNKEQWRHWRERERERERVREWESDECEDNEE
jgi:hypothetical protein